MNNEDKHKLKMQKLKENIDTSISKANISKGIGILLTGNGKGKTSSAFGMAIRALGYDYDVAIIQFIKGFKEFAHSFMIFLAAINIPKFIAVPKIPLKKGMFKLDKIIFSYFFSWI